MIFFLFPRWQKDFSFRESREGFVQKKTFEDSTLGQKNEKKEEQDRLKLEAEQQKVKTLAQKVSLGTATLSEKIELRRVDRSIVEDALKGESKELLKVLDYKEEDDFSYAFGRLKNGGNLRADWEMFTLIPPSKAVQYLKSAGDRAKYFLLFERFLKNPNRIKSPEAYLLMKSIDSDTDFLRICGKKEKKILLAFRTTVMESRGFFVLENAVEKAQSNIRAVTAEIREKEEIATQEDTEIANREKEMQRIITENLGKAVADRAMLARQGATEEVQKNRAMFEVIEQERQKLLLESRNQTIPEIGKMLEGSFQLYSKLLQLANITVEERSRQMHAMETHYKMLGERLLALKSGSDSEYAQKLQEQEVLSSADLQSIQHVLRIQEKMLAENKKLSEKFRERRIEIIEAKRQWEESGKNDGDTEMYCKKFCGTNFPISPTQLKRFFNNGEGLEPLDFSDIQAFEKRYFLNSDISSSPVPEMIKNPENAENMGFPEESLAHYFSKDTTVSSAVVSFFHPQNVPRYISAGRKIIIELTQLETTWNATLVEDLSDSSIQKKIKTANTEAFDIPKVQNYYAEIKTEVINWAQLLQKSVEGQTDEKARNARIAVHQALQYAQELPIPTAEQIKKAQGNVGIFLKDYFRRHGGDIPHEKKHFIYDAFEKVSLSNVLADAREKTKTLEDVIVNNNLHHYLTENFSSPTPTTIQMPNAIAEMENERNALEEIITLVPNIIRAIQENKPLPEEFLYIKKPNGSDLFARVSTEDWAKRGWEKKASAGFMFDIQNTTILLREDQYDSLEKGDVTIAHRAGIGHELAHMIDFYANEKLPKDGRKVGAKGLEELIKTKFPELQKIVEAIILTESDANKFEEIFASLVVGGNLDDNMERIADSLKNDPDFKNLLERSYSAFSENFRESPGLRRKGYAAQGESTISAQESADFLTTPADIEHWRSQIASAQTSNRKKLEVFLKDAKSPLGKQYGEQMIEKINEQMSEFLSDPRESTALQIIALHDAADGSFSGDVDLLTKQVSEQMAKVEEEPEYFKELWKNTTFLSMKDVGRLWTTFTDYIVRKHQTKSKRRMGKAGQAMFEGVIDQLSNDFDREKESAEQEEVDKYKKAIANKDAWQVFDFIKNSSHPDELKAGLRALADKGRIDWNNEEIWDALTRFSGVKFYESDKYNLALRASKIQRACERIWDAQEYGDLESTNQGKIESQVKKYEKEIDNYVNKIPVQIEQMLKNKREGAQKVDPHRYESFVVALAKRGKGNPEHFFYYVVAGVASGLLTPERAMAIQQQFTNAWPPLQIINQMNPDQQQYEVWVQQIKDIHLQRTGKPIAKDNFAFPDRQDVSTFMYLNIMEATQVRDRVFANKDGAQFDHDHARVIASIGDESMAISITAGATGGNARFKASIYNNIQVGVLDHITTLARNRDRMSESKLREVIARQAGYVITMDALLKERLLTGKNATYRLKHNELQAIPREGGAYSKTLKTGEYMKKNYEIYSAIPDLEKFFKILLNQNERSEANLGKSLNKLFTEDPRYIRLLSELGLSAPNAGKEGAKEGFDMIQTLVEYYLDPQKVGPLLAKKNMDAILDKAENTYNEDHK